MRRGPTQILIIGAGFAGAALAYCLAKQKRYSIRLVERESSFGVHASGRNAAMLRQAVADPEVANCVQRTRCFLENNPENWEGAPLIKRTGSILLGKKKQIAILAMNAKKNGSRAQSYDHGCFPDGLPVKLKSILMNNPYECLLYTPEDGVVDIHRYLDILLKSAQSYGAEVAFNTEVLDLNWNGKSWLVRDSTQSYEVNIVVNAAGAWATQVGMLAGTSSFEMVPLRRHLVFSENLDLVDSDWPFVWDVDTEVYFRPETGGVLFSPGDEAPHSPCIPQPDPSALELLGKKIAAVFPALLPARAKRTWACLRMKTASGEMVIGQDPEKKGFFWVSALGGHGVGASMGIGEMAANLIAKTFG